MYKGIRLIKRMVALVLVFLLSIESFAAVVGDNDGAAFITKAEFDSLKSDFQSEIDKYNTSLDSKIDGAIASYIAGVKIDNPNDNLWDRVVSSIGQKLKMRNEFSTGSSASTSTYAFSYSRYNDIYEATDFNVTMHAAYNPSGGTDPRYWKGFWRIETRIGQGSGVDSSSQNYAMINFPTDAGSSWPAYWGWRENVKWTNYENMVKEDRQKGDSSAAIWLTNSENPTYTYRWIRYSITGATSSSGSGGRWLYHENPDGTRYLQSYNPRYGLNVQGQFYYKCIQIQSNWNINGTSSATSATYPSKHAKYMQDSTRGDDTTQTITARLGSQDVDGSYVKLGTIASNDGKPAYSSGTRSGSSLSIIQSVGTSTALSSAWRGNYWSLNYSVEKASDNIDYTLDQWGKNTNKTLYTNRDVEQPVKGGTKTYNLSRDSFNNVYASLSGWRKQTNYIGQLNVTVDEASFPATALPASSFTNTYLTAVAGEIVHLGGGVPIAKSNNNDATIKIKGKFGAVSGTGTNDNIKYILSNKQFVNGAVAAGAKTLASGTIKLNTNFEHTIDGIAKDAIVWINFYDDTTNGAVVTIDTLEVK